MINVKVDDAHSILTVEMKGKVSEDELDQALDNLQQAYPGVGVHVRGQGRHYSVLADWRDLEGWERGAKTLGTVTAKAIGETAQKIAVVADERLSEEEPRIKDVFPGASVRFFKPSDWDDALAWLRLG